MERSFEVYGMAAACLSAAALTLALLTTGGIRIGGPYLLSVVVLVLALVLVGIAGARKEGVRADRTMTGVAFGRLPAMTRWTVKGLQAACVLVAVATFFTGEVFRTTETRGAHYYVYDVKPAGSPHLEVSYAEYRAVLMREERLLLAAGGTLFAVAAHTPLPSDAPRHIQPRRRRRREPR
ncbi:hypothetical protein ACIQNU_35100 [Streptomyces sp. NPDC091292]|uniref:hypothetical protein n=1 Tax=Streptomyces sp. NPDC091292 TaxID=3365991 RepID=UPI00380A8FF0